MGMTEDQMARRIHLKSGGYGPSDPFFREDMERLVCEKDIQIPKILSRYIAFSRKAGKCCC